MVQVMRYQLVTGRADGSDVILFARREDGRKVRFKVIGFEPYFYIEEGESVNHPLVKRVEKGGYLSTDKRALVKVVTYLPEYVPEIRAAFKRHYEADIKYVRRFLIDTGIRGGFETSREDVVHYKELKSSDFALPPDVCFIDIEVYSKSRFANPDRAEEKVICTTIYHQGEYHTLLLDDSTSVERRAGGWNVYRVKDERSLIGFLNRFLTKRSPDVLAGWNVDFDVTYLERRARRLGLELKLDGVCPFDLLKGYSKLYKKGGNRLKEVAFREGFTDEVESDTNYGVLWEEDREELMRRNLNHVRWIKLLNDKYGLVEFYWNLKNYAGLESMEGTLYAGVLVDTLMLRKYKGRYVLPSKSEVREEELTGALILKPEAGLYEGVAVFDVSRYYPNLLANSGLSPEGEGIVPAICRELLAERERFERELKGLTPGTEEYDLLKAKRDAVKYLGEAVIGYFGSTSSRLYNPKIFNAVTRTAREGLEFLVRKVGELGYRALYADTDGIMVEVDMEKSEALLKALNEALGDWCRAKGMMDELRLKEDRYFRRVLFTGVKKRYAGWVVREGGRPADYIHIVGFEAIRRDSSLLTQRIQRDVFDIILRRGGQGLAEYLRDVIGRLRRGEFKLEEIAIRKTLQKPIDSYGKGGKGIPDFVRGCLYANKYLGLNIVGGDMVKMVYVKAVKGYPKTDVLCFLDETRLPEIVLDHDKMVDRTVRMKVEDVTKVLGLSWDSICSSALRRQRNLTEVFR